MQSFEDLMRGTQASLKGYQQQVGGAPMGSPSYANLMDILKQQGQAPTAMEGVMPAISSLLAPGGQALGPYEAAIRKQTGANVAATQSDMMKRGLTGSDIEMSGMADVRAGGETAVATMYGQTANQLSGLLMQAFSSDRTQSTQALQMLAQAMGQKIQSDQDLMMFREQLQAAAAQAQRNRKSSMWGSLIGAGGSMAGGALTGYMSRG